MVTVKRIMVYGFENNTDDLPNISDGKIRRNNNNSGIAHHHNPCTNNDDDDVMG